MKGISGYALDLLEFGRIRKQVAVSCLSEEGRVLLDNQEVSTNTETIQEHLDFQTDLKRLTEASPLPPLDFPPIRSCLPKFDKEGAVAEGKELSSVGRFLRSAAVLRKHLLQHAASDHGLRADRIIAFATALPELSAVAMRILFLLTEDGAVNENRVPELKAIRREMQKLHRDIATLTVKYLSDDREIWQADVPTERDGRTVLPLKANYRGRVQGIVHEVSTTGATVFIEPTDIVERNNRLVERNNHYRREVHRVLKELTELVHGKIEDTRMLVMSVSFFDSMYARVRYAQIHRCSRAARSQRRILLRGARHPFLGKEAVPLDFELGETADIMVVTGANAGGKTVTLKTVGLLALMNQWGMEIPAAEGSELPIFEKLLVDIGDDQSITNNLSTFSGHMNSLATIISESDTASLVLLDEIGSGTDPAEGSAFAMAILDHLLEKRSLVVATTHHGSIKRYGYSKPHITNASVSFDAATLSPTYRLVIGIPGESHALEIAARSRIPPEILDRAREYVEAERTDLDREVEELTVHRRKLEEQGLELERMREELGARAAAVSERETRLREVEEAMHVKEHGELKAFLLESRRLLENLVRELRTGEITREKTLKVKGFIDKIEEKLADEEKEPSPAPVESREGTEAIESGSEVYVGKNRRRGTVLRRIRGDKWLVAVNTLRMTVPAADLHPVRRRTGSEKMQRLTVVVAQTGNGESPAFELDLRGMRLEEALDALERRLDHAILSGMAEFSVIHGKGEGILRRGVHRLLKSSQVVADFYFSPPEAGGFGKTIVKLGK